MKALVAGGAGMIGSHLCEELLLAGHEVVCLDNLSTGRARNIERYAGDPRFRFLRHDVTEELPDVGPVDRVYHLASPASPIGYSRLPIETMLANSEGTRRLIDRALLHGARFLFCSTSEIYGDPLEHPQREDYRGNVSSIGPRATYDESKRYGEAMTMAYVRTFGLDGRIVRIFNTYGPRADLEDGRVVVNFITQALRVKPMTIYGDGRQTRSLCFVTDLVEGLLLTMESDLARGEVINLGNPEERSVMELAELIRSMTGSSSPLLHTEPAVGDDPRLRRPNIDKARKLLGWMPRTALETGLRIVIREVRSVLEERVESPLNGDAGLRNGHAAEMAPKHRSPRSPLPSGHRNPARH